MRNPDHDGRITYPLTTGLISGARHAERKRWPAEACAVQAYLAANSEKVSSNSDGFASKTTGRPKSGTQRWLHDLAHAPAVSLCSSRKFAPPPVRVIIGIQLGHK
jgi:hypothetical protein